MAKLTDDELLAYVQEQERTSIGYNTDSLTSGQNESLWRYLGLPYGDEVEGRSQAVSMDASQVVDWALPDLLEPFVSGRRVVEFMPATQAEEEGAENATKYINWLFSVDNPGFELLHSAAKDGLVQKLGVTKILWDASERVTETTQTGQSSTDLARLRADPEVEVLDSSSEKVKLSDDPTVAALQAAAFPDGKVYTIDIRHTDEDGRPALASVPPEEFRISSRASSTVEPQYIGHTTEMTKGQIVELLPDVDEGLIEEAADTFYGTREGEEIRFYNQPHKDRAGQGGAAINWRMTKRWLHEEYVSLDWNGDGDTEVMQIFRIGNTILGTNEVRCNSFATFSPFPLPHSAIGQSMVDKVRQTQRIKTVLTRQMLDNVYLANNPQREVPEDAVTDDGSTYDDLLQFRVGGLVRTKKPGLLREIPLPDRSQTALAAIQHMDLIREKETGVVPGAVGASAEDIDRSGPITANESERRGRNQQKRVRLMQRVFAEMYLAPLFSKILQFVVAHQDKPRWIKLSGEWVEMDPRPWNANMRAIPAVGLGHETSDDEALATSAIANAQQQLAPFGMVNEQNAWQTFTDLLQALGRRFPEKYAADPNTPAGKQQIAQFQQAQAEREQQPDPALMRVQIDGQAKMAKVQQDGQLAAMKMQQDGQIDMAKAQMQQQTDMAKAQLSAQGDSEEAQAKFAVQAEQARASFEAQMVKIAQDAALQQEKIDAEFALAVEKQNREFALAIRGQNIEMALAEEKIERDGLNGSGNGLERDRPGGRLDA